jgi:hypothetical protein
MTQQPQSKLAELLSREEGARPTDIFFDAIAKKIETRTHAEARRDLMRMLVDMRYQTSRAEIILGTKGEQEVFLARLEELLINPGIYTSQQMGENVQALISEELAKGITRARTLNLSLGVDLLKPKDIEFNFPMVDVNTTLVPIDLHLTFDPNHTIEDALHRLFGQYRGRFNAIILLNSDKSPRGLITLSTLQSFDPSTQLADVPLDTVDEFGTVDTPKDMLEQRMHEIGVNIYPIVDRETRGVIGILTHENITLTDTRYYTATLQAQVGESLLKQEIEK